MDLPSIESKHSLCSLLNLLRDYRFERIRYHMESEIKVPFETGMPDPEAANMLEILSNGK